MAKDHQMSVLVLSLDYGHRVSYYNDWADAFERSALFRTTRLNVMGLSPGQLARTVDEHDAVILLHGCNADTLEFLEPIAPALAGRRRARALTFVGNEFNSPYLSMAARNALFRRARIDIIATQLLEEAGEYLYQSVGARVISVPHALNPDAFRPGPASAERRLDIGVKGYRYPPYLGDEDRNRLLERFQRLAESHGLACDISEDRRLDRKGWADFLCSCRGTISSEAGSWYLRPDDTLMRPIGDYLAQRRRGLVISSDCAARRLARRLPMPVKSALWRFLKLGVVRFDVIDDFNVPFEELEARFFRHAARSPAYGKAISSRHFDAIGTKTCQLLLHGRYSDILVADRHYIAIAPDHSNIEEAIRRFKDRAEREAVADRALELILEGHTYAHRARQVYEALAGL